MRSKIDKPNIYESVGIAKGLLWDFSGKIIIQFSGFLVTLVLARLLTPAEYGLIGIAFMLVGVSRILVDLGMNVALIQKKEVTIPLLSTVFWFNLLLSLLAGSIIFLLRFNIATFFKNDDLIDVVAWISLLIPLQVISLIPITILSRKLNFRAITISETLGSIVGGLIGILLAYKGYGVYSLIAQAFSQAATSGLFTWIYSRFSPLLTLKLFHIKEIWHFSSRQMLLGIMNTLFNQTEVFMIGKVFSASTLGHFTRARSLNNLVVRNSSESLARVLFPAFSSFQEQHDLAKSTYWKSYKIVTIISVGITLFLFINAKEIVLLLFGNQWELSGGYFKIIVLSSTFFSLGSIMIALLKGMGEISIIFNIAILKKSLIFIPILIGVYTDIHTFLYSMVGYNMVCFFINMVIIVSYVTQNLVEHIKKLTVYSFCAVIIGYLFLIVPVSDLSRLLISMATIPFSWSLIVYILDRDLFSEAINRIKRIAR